MTPSARGADRHTARNWPTQLAALPAAWCLLSNTAGVNQQAYQLALSKHCRRCNAAHITLAVGAAVRAAGTSAHRVLPGDPTGAEAASTDCCNKTKPSVCCPGLASVSACCRHNLAYAALSENAPTPSGNCRNMPTQMWQTAISARQLNPENSDQAGACYCPSLQTPPAS